ncbi:hypothetical protein F5984_18820 [Rudanella paleaurantiibacter]|uniref:Uncharacterized protein n=1 Tax=Rudanella paleaurantiibacter TaxID=2614655 RepID=A0A7J5TVV0_9BACT|nr:hypothetical protein [Rudanella paleaurantiibacter]KAB7728425.1 hypothetical protein F5984_18820 [Rudanella paleaurantiibacter]
MQRYFLPSWVRPEFLERGPVVGRVMTLPAGKVYAISRKRKDTPAEAYEQRGATHVHVLDGLTPAKQHTMPNWEMWANAGANANCSNLNEAQSRAVADAYPITGFIIDQFGEGPTAVCTSEKPQYRWFMQRLLERAAGAGFPTVLVGSYGDLGMYQGRFLNLVSGSRDPLHRRGRYGSKAAARGTNSFYTTIAGLNLGDAIASNVSYYPHNSQEFDRALEIVHSLEINSLANDRGCYVIPFPMYETPNNPPIMAKTFDWHHETTSPAGVLTIRDYGSSALTECVMVGFSSMWFGRGLIEWHDTRKFVTDRNKFKSSHPDDARQDFWAPAPGSPAQFPYTGNHSDSTADSYTTQPLWGYDYIRAGVEMYHDLRDTEGGNRAYAPYYVDGQDGNAWQEPASDGATVLVQASKKMGIAQTRTKNGLVSGFFYDPYAIPNAQRRVTIKHPGGSKTWTFDVVGNELVTFNDSL